MTSLPKTRSTFALLRLNPGQCVQLDTGTQCRTYPVHWTSRGVRICARLLEGATCAHCVARESAPRWNTYLPVLLQDALAPKLWIASELQLAWANDSAEILSRRMALTRSTRTRLIKAEVIGPNIEQVPSGGLDRWLSCLLGISADGPTQ